MKKCVKNLLVSFVVLASMSANAAFTYDKDTQILTDGVWTFKEIGLAKDGVSMAVKGSLATKKPDVPSRLDFSDVKDSSGKALKVVTLGGFEGLNVSEVIAPDCTAFNTGTCFRNCAELRKIVLNESFENLGGVRTFAGCTSLEEFFPRTLQVTEVTGYAFSGCTSLSGSFVLPKCTIIKTYAFLNCALLESVSAPLVDEILEGAFSGCSSMARIEIVSKIANYAFKDVAPGAEVYTSDIVPESLGVGFVGNLTGPFPKFICLEETLEQYLDKIRVNHHVILKSQFNTDLGQEFEYKTGMYRKWKDIAAKMAADTQMCESIGDEITIKRKGVVAFVLQKSTNQHLTNLVGFWVMKTPKKGFAIIVR